MPLTLRRTKLNGLPAPLTNDELDDNFVFLENEILNLVSVTDELNDKSDAASAEIIDTNANISAIVARLNILDDTTENLTAKDVLLDGDVSSINSSINDLQGTLIDISTLTDNLVNRPFLSDETIVVERSAHIPNEITIKASNLLVHTTKSQTLTNKIISGSSNSLINIPASSLSGKVAIINGGTNADSASIARTNLGLEIGKDVQGYNAQTVISTNTNTFTNTNYFNHNGFFLANLSQANPKTVSFRLSNSSGASNHVLTIPEKTGTLATLDDINTNGVLRNEDIGVRVLAYDSNIAYKNRDNYFENNVTQNFSNAYFVLRDSTRSNTTAKFVMGTVSQIASISMGVPPESGILATREYVENLFGAQVVSNFSTPGYYIMPGGLILQWGSLLINQTQQSCANNGATNFNHKHTTTYGEIIFPVVFPNSCFTVTATPRDSSPAYIDGCEMAIGIIKKQNEKFNFLVNRISGCTSTGEVSMYVDFIAIGW